MRLVIPINIELSYEPEQKGGLYTEPIERSIDAYIFSEAFEFSINTRDRMQREISSFLTNLTREEFETYVGKYEE